MNPQEIEKKLAFLRLQWQKYPEKRKIIEIQAKLLRIAQAKKEPEPKLPT